jgi:hypothetical protein
MLQETIVQVLDNRISQYKRKFSFVDSSNHVQVEGSGEEINREFGAYEALSKLREDIERYADTGNVYSLFEKLF